MKIYTSSYRDDGGNKPYCSVCGFVWDKLGDPNWVSEICSCCGIQPGYTDAPYINQKLNEIYGKDYDCSREEIFVYVYEYYDIHRSKWIAEGMKFRSEWCQPIPLGWNPIEQLKNIGVFVLGTN
jgi:hypothetical protein